MPGMKNAKGTVKGVYDTYAYVVSYEPTNGDKRIKTINGLLMRKLIKHLKMVIKR